MNRVFLATRKFWCDENGVTAIEYALVAASIAIAVIVTVFLIGQQVNTFFSHLKDCMDSPSTC
ncbi:MAG: Flp family type IVb pilin [Rhodoferax sp.]|uniref:Flp family type IVb pilin n=1 Tax=Rhodoferax sp. TaxID=50421 RepID=UPI00185A4834|nr:Flp family type IVb pilin [Rhodoferax sp.]NMM20021.1 Flp family type IVb pilin [Rhodoferax sp.]